MTQPQTDTISTFADHSAAIEAAQGYASDPQQWNPPSPQQVAHLLRLSGIAVDVPIQRATETQARFTRIASAIEAAIGRLEINDMDGEEQPFMDQLDNALSDLNALLQGA